MRTPTATATATTTATATATTTTTTTPTATAILTAPPTNLQKPSQRSQLFLLIRQTRD
jgi:hypothetical protein